MSSNKLKAPLNRAQIDKILQEYRDLVAAPSQTVAAFFTPKNHQTFLSKQNLNKIIRPTFALNIGQAATFLIKKQH